MGAEALALAAHSFTAQPWKYKQTAVRRAGSTFWHWWTAWQRSCWRSWPPSSWAGSGPAARAPAARAEAPPSARRPSSRRWCWGCRPASAAPRWTCWCCTHRNRPWTLTSAFKSHQLTKNQTFQKIKRYETAAKPLPLCQSWVSSIIDGGASTKPGWGPLLSLISHCSPLISCHLPSVCSHKKTQRYLPKIRLQPPEIYSVHSSILTF